MSEWGGYHPDEGDVICKLGGLPSTSCETVLVGRDIGFGCFAVRNGQRFSFLSLLFCPLAKCLAFKR